MPLHFYERPTLVLPVFANQKETKRGFCLCERQEVKIALAFVCSGSLPASRVVLLAAAPSPETTLSISASSRRALHCVCEHLRGISVYFVHPLPRCVLGYQKSPREVIFGVWECSKSFPYELMVIASLLYAISAYKRIHRGTLLSASGTTPVPFW